MEPDKAPASSPISKLFDVSLILALGTGGLYFLNVEYLYAYYSSFNLDYTMFPLPLPETLVACPYIVVFLAGAVPAVIRNKATEMPWALLRYYPENLTLSTINGFFQFAVLMLLAILAGSFYGHFQKVNSVPAIMYLKDGDKKLSGFCLLKKSEGHYFFFKNNGFFKSPDTLILKEEFVKGVALEYNNNDPLK